ncbi:MAG: integrase arm-type DNA-binding domain-containing protein [Alphaproteobacteria bacterium]|nr:integrase arm-type DNA-binding domain-containing protein [Alphaproteobacteria bacterium]MDE2110510.1 integrase arm-type DNA-binding domain-containing protein [Alphaproteobacteria bacterium]MDE2493260.1 integrase arm-type DNA-binding domain-containing protein [Alphaproteobacteria bacterium]
MPLTDSACKSARPKPKAYKRADIHGLYLHVAPNGSRYWRLKYRFLGKERVLALGVYPEVSLAEAREKRAVARKLLADGIDPSSAKRETKQRAILNATNTFEAVAREWHEHNLERWTPAYAKEILHRLEMDIFPVIGRRPVADITPLILLDALRKIERRGAHEMAHRATQYCGQIFRYAVVTGRVERNPTTDLKGALKPVRHSHFAALEPKDLPGFLQALERNEARLFNQTRLAIQLMMLTFVRTGELIKATWKEFDLDGAEWSIPAERMKMGKPHLVPLSRQAVAVIRQLHQMKTPASDWVFSSLSKPRQHMSNNTILKALERMGYKGRMTGHGFRALAMTTIKENLRFPHEVVDRQLAHAPRNAVDAAYDRTKFIDERRRMMQAWADYLDVKASEGKVIFGKFGKGA